MPAPPRTRLITAAFALATIACGVILRLTHLGLSPALVKYGGSALWAVMIYWLCALAIPHARPLRLALLAAGIAIAVELFKLCHTPALDSFRLTLPGKLLLGRVFSVADIAVYWLAIAAVAALDRAAPRQPSAASRQR